MKFRLQVVVLLLLMVALASGAGPKASGKIHAPDAASYVLALATANRFLNAWQAGDLETGIVLLSDHARHSQTSESLENLFSPAIDRAFEITRGKGNHERYCFPVVMLSRGDHRVHRRFSAIVLVNTGTNEWVVDRLP